MPSPAGKKAWGEGTIEGSKGSRRGPSIGPELTNYSPEQYFPHQVSWHQGLGGRRSLVPQTYPVASVRSLLISG